MASQGTATLALLHTAVSMSGTTVEELSREFARKPIADQLTDKTCWWAHVPAIVEVHWKDLPLEAKLAIYIKAQRLALDFSETLEKDVSGDSRV